MRLDLFLKKTRIIKRRSVAAEMAKGAKITRDGHPLKPSGELRDGDELEIRFGNRILRVKVRSVEEKNPEVEILSEISL
ncbi:MAG TPA: S4 domain-containing protein [Thermotogota bacterium]|mgnify:CR=1 FL=1|nr:S4 domain-containing protein [Thermotogota bacterium]HRW92144.1 S4 domain-containing protein [Thermotogota bacterium]